MEKPEFDAVVVGAGVAGLFAARKLSKEGASVCVVEAQDALGGRVTQIHGVAPWPLEAGPEFIHGANSHLVHLCKEVGMSLTEAAWPDHVFWGDQKRWVRACEEKSEELEQLDELMFDELPKQDFPATDISVKQWMQQRGTPARVQELADVCYSNDFCCSLHELGMTEAIIESRKWDSGEEYLLKDRSLKHLIDYLAAGIAFRTRWPVSRIEWVPGRGAKVVSAGGECLSCRSVVCAVPLSQLQNSSIAFVPPMPAAQRAAIHRIKMGNAVKVYCLFSTRFWPERLWDVVCTHRLFPEFWITRYPVEDLGQVHASEVFCVTAFCTGDRAKQVGAMTPSAAVAALVAQLDDMFGSPGDRPAQRSLLRGYVRDWSKTPFIQGAYTHPTLGAHVGDRTALAASLGGVVFFAGEHTQPDMNPCLQGAMETGDRAATQVLLALRQTPSRL